MADNQPLPDDNSTAAHHALLRAAARELLARQWPVDQAVERAGDPAAVAAVWREMVAQGFAAVGTAQSETGLREAVLIFEELGRAACPAPLLGAVVMHSVLAPSEVATLARGEAIIGVALAGHDGDIAAGRVAMADGLTGVACFVENAEVATDFLVFTTSPTGVALVARDAAGLVVTPNPGLAVPALATLRFDHVPARWFEVPLATLVDVAAVARLACAARALGAAERAFEMAVEHAKLRQQFGRLIGQFQAVQHKLADGLINLDGARQAVESAAAARDSGDADWRVFADAALAFAGPALRDVSIQTHRALGAIGYAEEHEAPRHFRRVHADLARFGGVSRARAALADYLLGPIDNGAEGLA